MAKSKTTVEEVATQKPLGDAVEALTVLCADISGEYAREYIGTADEIRANREAFAQAKALLDAAARDFNRALARHASKARGELAAIESPKPVGRVPRFAEIDMN